MWEVEVWLEAQGGDCRCSDRPNRENRQDKGSKVTQMHRPAWEVTVRAYSFGASSKGWMDTQESMSRTPEDVP